MYIVAELRSIEFSGQLPESNNFLWVPVNYPSLNELVSMLELRCTPTQFRLPCTIYACYCSAMILLFLDLLALFHSIITMISIQSQSIWAFVPPQPVLTPGSIQVQKFFHANGELNPNLWR
jgi:hypothetical protein